uniref:Uncharacterized protein n=1 Tax=Tanacetum cinerariifolium TaxID=118510 RepID=A0A6L2MIK3_TANCI|nr:hypothetical protein [Tanacetum cinerariifolium]
MDQLEKQLDNKELQEIRSMATFKVLETQFQMFIKSRIYLDDEYVVMTRNYFLQYIQLEIPEFRDTLIQHMKSVKKSIDKRALHKRQYDSWIAQDDVVLIANTLISAVVCTSAIGSSSYMGLISASSSCASFPDLLLVSCSFDYVLLLSVLTELASNALLISTFSSIVKPVLQPHRNQPVVRQPTAFKSERPRISKPRFASQIDMNNDLLKPVTTHYLPKGKESACAKPNHKIASRSSRYRSNDMVHNHYLEEAKKKTQEKGGNRRENFKTVGFRWVPTGKIFTSSTTKVDSEPTNGSNKDITNQYGCEQTLDVSTDSTTCTMFSSHLVDRGLGSLVKDNKEKDKIKAKTDKIKSKREAQKSPDSSLTKLKPSQNQESIKGVSGTRSFVILIKHPTCLNDPLRTVLSVDTRSIVIIVKDVLFSERNLRKIFLHLVLNMEFSKILSSHPMTIPTLLMLIESHSLAIKTSVKSPSQINHHCCYDCGDPLEGIFCHQCTCKLCGNGAHYGYNCPSKVLIIPNPEPFNNQTIKELPQTVQSFDPKSDLVYDSPNVFNPPSQLPFIPCEFCGNDARYGHYCTPQVPSVYPKPCYNQEFNFS